MTFSLKSLSIAVAWFALIFALVYQVHVEANRAQWSSQVPTGILLLVNSFVSVFTLLTAIAVRPSARMFWVGCTCVACLLTLGQVFDLKPNGIGMNGALLLEGLVLPDLSSGRNQMYRSGYLIQLENILIYGMIPPLSALGGWYTQSLHQKHQRPA